MKVLIAPDKFKGSLTSVEVIEAISAGLLEELPTAEVISQPLADGGEGTLDVLEASLNLERVSVEVQGPLFSSSAAYYLTDGEKAFIEMAVASGLQLVPLAKRNPLRTSTFGTGELIRHALLQGLNEVNLFVGGSATNDCGLGMAKALGYAFFDKQGNALAGTGADLIKIHIMEKNSALPELKEARFNILTDVQNPLLGSTGCAQYYAAQKGASQEVIEQLERGAMHLATLLSNGFENEKGAGAAGGLGFGALSFLHAQISSGIEFVLNMTEMREKIRKADLVITGEGSLDEQSLQGKVIDGLKKICDEEGKSLAIICGKSEINEWKGVPIYQVIHKAKDLEDAMSNSDKHVRGLAQDLMRDFRSTTT